MSLILKTMSYLGRGAYMRGDFALKKGEVIKILVGQKAVVNTVHQSSGGGGGSFVAKNNNVPLLVAWGGGGLEKLSKRLENCDASKRHREKVTNVSHLVETGLEE